MSKITFLSVVTALVTTGLCAPSPAAAQATPAVRVVAKAANVRERPSILSEVLSSVAKDVVLEAVDLDLTLVALFRLRDVFPDDALVGSHLDEGVGRGRKDDVAVNRCMSAKRARGIRQSLGMVPRARADQTPRSILCRKIRKLIQRATGFK